MKTSRFLSYLLMAVLSLPITGCWDYDKINERTPIIGIGADPIKGDDKNLAFTFQVQMFTGENAGSSKGQKGERTPNNFKNYHAIAPDLHTAMAIAQTLSIKKFYLGDFNLLLINRHLKAPQVAKVVLEFIRDSSSDRLAYLFCADKSANEILSAKGSQVSPADALHDQLESEAMQKAYMTRTKVWEFWRDILRIAVEPKLGVLTMRGKSFDISGTEAFSGYQPTLKLNRHETVFFHLFNDSLHDMAFTIPDQDKMFEVDHVGSSSRIAVRHKGHDTILFDHIVVNATLSNDENENQTALSKNEIQRYEKVMRSYLQKQGLKVMQKLQKHKLDIYGFGQYEVVKHPEDLKEIQNKWPTTFANAKPQIQLEVHINHTGTLM